MIKLKRMELLLLTLVGTALMARVSMRGGESSDGSPAAALLRPRIQDKNVVNDNQENAISQSLPPNDGDVFVPGSLHMTRLETFEKCYADPRKYYNHFNTLRGLRCSISQKYNITYFMIAKAGSSTSRFVMKNSFDGVEKTCEQNDFEESQTFHFTFFREPTSRFFSSYQEAFIRTKSNVHKVPEKYKQYILPFENMKRPDYLKLINSQQGQKVLLHALETFVHLYDAQDPFDGHLRLQIPRLVNPNTGRTFRLDGIYDTTRMEQDFESLANMVNATSVNVIHAYDRGTKRLDTTNLSREARRKICQLSALDYCCLNYELPEECNDVVKCRWISKPNVSDDLLVEPMSPFPPEYTVE